MIFILFFYPSSHKHISIKSYKINNDEIGEIDLAEFVEFMTIVCRKSRDGEGETDDKKEDEEDGNGLKFPF